MTTTKALRSYKAFFILDTRNYQNPVETLIEKLTNVVEAVNGSVKKIKNFGQKDFSRVTNRKFPGGIYVEINFEGPAEAPLRLKEKLKLEKTVNRIFVVSN
ncbi:MAG: 30S ribosomal protein S6 [Verrucomicrobia bacterium]|nr:MAG: 30S ribosomal protein S6 [Verrucomicrobiota bacterium]